MQTEPAKAPWEVEAAIEKLRNLFSGIKPTIKIETAYDTLASGAIVISKMVLISGWINGECICVVKHQSLQDVLALFIAEAREKEFVARQRAVYQQQHETAGAGVTASN